MKKGGFFFLVLFNGTRTRRLSSERGWLFAFVIVSMARMNDLNGGNEGCGVAWSGVEWNEEKRMYFVSFWRGQNNTNFKKTGETPTRDQTREKTMITRE